MAANKRSASGAHVVTEADLASGRYKLKPGPALRVRGVASGHGVRGGPAQPVYVVNGTQLEGRGIRGGGEVMLVATAEPGRAPAGRVAIPVYVVNPEEWPEE